MLKLDSIARRRPTGSVLTDVTLHVQPGECVGIDGGGEDGASLLLRIAATLVTADSGSLSINGVDARRDVYRARLHVAYAAGPAHHGNGLTAIDHVETVWAGRGRRAHRQTVLDTLDRVGLRGSEDVAALTADQRRRLAIVAACAAETSVLLLDDCLFVEEPWTEPVVALVEGRRVAGTAIVVADRRLPMGSASMRVARLCTRVAALHGGRLIDANVGARPPLTVDSRHGVPV